MAKFLDVSGMMNKVKSVIDQMTGPGATAKTEEALKNETDPFKAKLLELELVISEISDIQLILAKKVNQLYQEYQNLKTELLKEHSQTAASGKETQAAAAVEPQKPTSTTENQPPKDDKSE